VKASEPLLSQKGRGNPGAALAGYLLFGALHEMLPLSSEYDPHEDLLVGDGHGGERRGIEIN
jgi:hypothetical protein